MSKNKRVRNTTPTPIIGSIDVVLKPSPHITDEIYNAKGEYKSIALPLPGGNPKFPPASLSITMAQFLLDITDYDNKESNLHTKPPTSTAEDRNGARKVVKDDRELLRSDVEKVARKDPRNAAAIVASANMLLKRVGGRIKFVGSKNTKVAGVVLNTAAEGGPHDWWQNDGATNLQLRSSKGAKKTVKGLTIGKDYTFSSAPILAEKDGDGPITVHPTITVSTLH